jgi:NAD(P)H-hydrate epimerase
MSCPIRPLSRLEVRQLDAHALTELGLPTLVLMENAGRGAAAWLAELATACNAALAVRPFSSDSHESGRSATPPLPNVLVLCGAGNNGGDGGVVARHLDAWGFPTRVCWFASPDQLRGDPLVQWRILENSGVDQSAWSDKQADNPDDAALDALLADADWIVDGLLGTGLTRPVEGALRRVVEAMNRSDKHILALDLPSGLDADTGSPLGVAVRAEATATFVAPKLGFSAPGAIEYTGRVAVIDIGLPRKSLEPFLAFSGHVEGR